MSVTTARIPSHLILPLPFGRKNHNPLISLKPFWARLSDALVAGDRVELRGFGAFTVKARAARAGRNPKTGETVPVGDKLVPAFKTGKGMQSRLNAPGAPAPAEMEATADRLLRRA